MQRAGREAGGVRDGKVAAPVFALLILCQVSFQIVLQTVLQTAVCCSALEARHAYQTYVPGEEEYVYEEVPVRPKKKKPKKEKKVDPAPVKRTPPPVATPPRATSKPDAPHDSSTTGDVSPPAALVPQIDEGKFNTANARIAYSKGNDLYGNRDWMSALYQYDNAIKSDPNLVDAYLKRGKCFVEKKDFVHAIQDFNKVIALDAKNGSAYRERGWAKEKLGQKQAAQDDLAKAKELGADMSVPTFNFEPGASSSTSSSSSSNSGSSSTSNSGSASKISDAARDNLSKRIMISLAMLALIALYWMFFGVFAIKGPQTKPWQTARFVLLIIGLAITTGLGLMCFASMLSAFKGMS